MLWILLGRLLPSRAWWNEIDENIVVGEIPFKKDVKKMAGIGIEAVINACEEYRGPIEEYKKFGIDQLHIPVIDYQLPSKSDILKAIEFIEKKIRGDQKVYIHCKAGRGRSATIALCWIMKNKNLTPAHALEFLVSKRPHVSRRLDKVISVQTYYQNIRSK